MKKTIAMMLPQAVADELGIKLHDGYLTPFSSREAEGAIRNGSRVIKIASDRSGDRTGIGKRGKVLGSITSPGQPELGIMYFIEWDEEPRVAVSCHAHKLAPVQ